MTKCIRSLLAAAIAVATFGLFQAGCSTPSQAVAGSIDTAAEVWTVKQLNSHPEQLAQLQSLAKSLPTAVSGSLTPDQISAVIVAVGQRSGQNSSTSLDFGAAVDGALRNYLAQNSAGGAQTINAAVIQGVLTTIADGINHGIALWQAAQPKSNS